MNFMEPIETIEALPKLRFVKRTEFTPLLGYENAGSLVETKVLQQLYKIENGTAGRTEWRDVPTEVEK